MAFLSQKTKEVLFGPLNVNNPVVVQLLVIGYWLLGIDLRDEKDTIDISSRLAGAFVGEDRPTDGCYAHRR